jgi:hypothetical protein
VLAARLLEAQTTEQQRGSPEALAAMLDLLDLAVDSAPSADALEAVAAALDAISTRTAFGLEQACHRHALAFRVPGGPAQVLGRLEAAWQRAGGGSWVRPLLASTGMALAMQVGDASLASTWRKRTGCVRAAAVVGPLDWAALSGLERPVAFESPGKPFPAASPGLPPFGAEARPHLTHADGCELETDQASGAVGLRAVVVEVDSPQPRRLWFGLTTTNAAVLTVGGQQVLRRSFEAGGGRVTRLGSVQVGAGRARVVVRVAHRDDGNRLVLSVVDEDGVGVPTRVPSAGEVAAAAGSRPAPVQVQPGGAAGAEQLLLRTSALLALGDGRAAEKLLEDAARGAGAPGMLSLQYARALDVGSVLPETRRVERQREAFETALSKLAFSWEAAVGLVALAGQRRGLGEGRLEAMSELQKLRDKGLPQHALLDLFEAAVAASAGMYDRAGQRLQRASASGSALTRSVEGQVRPRTGRDRVAWHCGPGAERDTLSCFEAQVSAGDARAALAELQRVRELRDSPGALREAELAQVIALGEADRALALYDAMPPARRSSAALGMVARSQPEQARQRLLRDLPELTDGPDAAMTMRAAWQLPDDSAWEQLASGLVAAERARLQMPEAATLVLEHREQYTISKRGVLTYTLFDLRRVAGTTDVEQGAQALGAMVEGRSSQRVLRRRIHKKDGRVLEPDQAANASQDHSDLSQLEQGDYVEQLVAGVAVPGMMGQLVVDTPDLLPQRTSVLHAEIEVRYPAGLKLSRWAHRALPAGQERTEGDQQVLRWELRSHGPRRMEAGVPKMEQEVSVSFGTQTWSGIAAGMGEVVQALRAQDPAVAKFARGAVGAEQPGTRLLEKLVTAVGKKVRVSSGAVLGDTAASFAAGSQETSARTILELGQGSRTWLTWQALAELNVPADIVVAESEPFASDAGYPAHVGRFDHPLLLVKLPADKGGETWLDLDVSGPPLPPGKVSPELRGRTALRSTGEMLAVPAGSETGPDEIDVRLKVDERGDARGTVTLLLRGRAAQVLLDLFEDRAGSERKDMLRSVVLGWIPWANVDEVVMSSAEGAWQLGVRASITIPGFAQPEGDSWVLAGMTPLHAVMPYPVSATIASTFASQGGRENALAIDTAFHYHLHRRVELPAGWSVQRAPSGFTTGEGPIQASRKVNADGPLVQEDFELSIPTGTIEASAFEEFAGRARRVDDAFLASIRVVKARRGK